jgi:cation/acetate symporter
MIGGASSFFGIRPEAFGAVGTMVSFGMVFLVGKFTREPAAHIQAMVEAAPVPRGSKLVTGSH